MTEPMTLEPIFTLSPQQQSFSSSDVEEDGAPRITAFVNFWNIAALAWGGAGGTKPTLESQLNEGWVEDIHNPHNWYSPFVVGTYASRQSLTSEMMTQFEDILNRSLVETDPTRRANIYKETNQLYYDQAIGLPLALSTSHLFEQRWVFGTIANPVYPGKYYYSIYKQ